MIRQRIWFLFIILVTTVLTTVLIIQYKTPSTSKQSPINDDQYLINEILPISDTEIGTTSVGNSPEKIKVIQTIDITEECFVGGCSNQLCTDTKNVFSTCEWRESYSCYNNATCEKQPDGECRWTKTDEIMECLFVAISNLEI